MALARRAGWVATEHAWALQVVLEEAGEVAGDDEALQRDLARLRRLLGRVADQARDEYRHYLVEELRDHTLRGFAPQVGGRHEPLLLLAGHLSLISQRHANSLLRAILAHPAPTRRCSGATSCSPPTAWPMTSR